MAEFINTVDVIGDEALTALIIGRSIVEYHDDSVLSIGDYGLAYCTELTSVDFPAIRSIGYRAFYENSKLTIVNVPNAISIGNAAFYNCTALVSVGLTSVTSFENSAFHQCSALTSADLPAATSIGSYVFNGCKNLKAVILRNNAVCTLSNADSFRSTPIASGTGYIYVPAALVDSYKSATNWSTYASFRALEDYTVDGTTTGALDPNKI